MSKTKNRNLFIAVFLILISFFAFGCKEETPVEDIYFKMEAEQEQIVLLLGQSLNLKEYVVVQPSYATNTDYNIESYDTSIIVVKDKTITAVKEGSTYIKAWASDNNKKQDVIAVSVKKSETVLSAPNNLTYNSQTQSFSFDAVTNAASYTAKINGQEIQLGNSTLFSLADYENKYNRVLSVQVKSNAAAYSYVFKNSQYSAEYKIYQSESVQSVEVKGGVLTFVKPTNSDAEIYLGENLIETITSTQADVSLNLNSLPASYAGINCELKILTIVKNSVKQTNGNSVNYYNSAAVSVQVSVLDAPTITLKSSTVSWNNVAGANSYNIYINNSIVATTNENFYNLENLANYEDYIKSADNYQLSVVPVNSAESKNTLQTTKQNVVSFNRLETPTISLTSNGIEWNTVENAEVYSITITYTNEEGEEETITKSIQGTSFSFANFEANTYTVSVQALAISNGGVSYLTSLVDTEKSVKQFTKHSTGSLFIENYTLNIATISNEEYSVEIDSVSINSSDFDEITANNIAINLNDYSFVAGTHTITVVRKGNGTTTIDSNSYSTSFVQLEAINSISISHNTASVIRSSINENATIKLVTTGGNLTDDIISYTLSSTYNTTDSLAENPQLGAGNYVVKVYVLGNGGSADPNVVSTFSCYPNDETKESANLNFSVLAAPIVSFNDSSKAEISYTEIANAQGYTIYKNGTSVATSTSTTCGIELENGSAAFSVQANGNNEDILSSAISSSITISRLETPDLSFNNTTDIISINYKGQESLLNTSNKYGVQLKNASRSDFETITYEFGSKFTYFEIGSNQIKAILNAQTKVGDVYYLNSKEESITLTKLNNETSFEVNENNKLVIKSKNTSVYDLELIINSTTFTIDGSNLVYNSYNLPFTYSTYTESGKSYIVYYVDLIDSNFNAILSEFKNGFTAQVKYIQPSTGNDTIVNSDYSSTSETLNLIAINETSVISVNTNNELVITPTNHSKEYFLNVVFTIGGTPYEFKSNEDKNILTYSSYELPYRYSAGSYYITLLENYQPIFIELTSSFSVCAKYCHTTSSSDVDSTYSSEKAITLLSATTLSRSEQSIYFENKYSAYDYSYYSIVVNGTQKIDLDSSAIVSGNYIYVTFEYIYSKITGAEQNAIYSIAVLTKNVATTQDSPLLSNMGASIDVKKQQALTISSSKDNDAENNSVIISFETFLANYSTTYKVYVTNDSASETKIYEVTAGAASETKSFNLDEIALLATLNVYAVIETTGMDGTTYVFNSDSSNTLTFIKISAPTNILATNGILSFDAVTNCEFYELYSVTGTSKTKIYSPSSNSFDLAALMVEKNLSGETKFVLKAISVESGYTNSAYSEEFTINKLSNPEVVVENGEFKVDISNVPTALLTDENSTITLKIVKADNSVVNINLIDISYATVSKSGNLIYIEPQLLLSYGTEKIIKEDLTFTYVVSYIHKASYYYLNSNNSSISAYGLFAPTDLAKNSGDLLSWTFNSKNTITGVSSLTSNVGYVFKIEYNDGENDYIFYSNDSNLKYYDETNGYVSYANVILNSAVTFPAAYDKNSDGILDENDVFFKAGTYKVSVKSVPNINVELEGYNLCSSVYGNACTFIVMEAPTAKLVNGVITWNTIENATSYKVYVYTFDALYSSTTLYTTETTTGTSTILSNLASKIYAVKVQAITTKDDVFNSELGNDIKVFKLASVSEVGVDDGFFAFKANKYYSSAIIGFAGAANVRFTCANSGIDDNLAALQETLTNGTDIEKLTALNNLGNTSNQFIASEQGLSLISGNYTLAIQLIGTTGSSYGFVNSDPVDDANLNFTANKLATVNASVNLGVITFNKASGYSETTFSYAFNGETDSSEFWTNTTIYKINITEESATHSFFVVDYNSFIENIDKLSSDNYTLFTDKGDLYAYVKYGNIILNVYKDNTINLRDSNKFYFYSTSSNLVSLAYTSSEEISCIDLTLGGWMQVDFFLLGGDGSSSLGYLSSSATDLQTFVRYGVPTLLTENGKLTLTDERIYYTPDPEQPSVTELLDYPIYKLAIKPINGKDEATTYIYLYHSTTGATNAKTIAARDSAYNEAKSSFVAIEFSSKTENTIVLDLSDLIPQNYTITIQTLAGVGVKTTINAVNYYLNSATSTDTTYYKFSTPSFTMEDSLLTFNLSSVTTLSGNNYAYTYEITLSNGLDSTVYTINSNSDGVTISGSKLKYNIPKSLLDSNTTYTIKAKALTSESMYLNGNYSAEYSFTKSSLPTVSVENGVLSWVVDSQNLTDYSYVSIKLNYGSNEEYIETSGTAVYNDDGAYAYHYYQFIDSSYNNGTYNFSVDSGVNYTISVRICYSDDSIVSSDYVEVKNMVTRLATVENSSIITESGILTWNAVANAAGYLVEVVGGDTYTYNTTTNSLDLTTADNNSKTLPSGANYSVYITALGSSRLHAKKSDAASGFTKLAEVTNIRTEEGLIKWDVVAGASKYNVKFNYTDASGDVQTENYVVETNECLPSDSLVGEFIVSVQAVSENSLIIASNYATLKIETERAIPVSDLAYNEELFRYEWMASEDFGEDDKLYITYDLVEKTASGSLASVNKNATLLFEQAGFYDSDLGIYYFTLSTIGSYSNFKVRVLREETIFSVALTIAKQLDFTIYSYGSGTEENPYVISTETQLLNIKYFANQQKFFKLLNDISLNLTSFVDNTYVIAEEFHGVLDGDNKVINTVINNSETTITLNSSEFALFTTLNGAKIKNLTIGNAEKSTKFLKSFDDAYSNVIKLSILATGVNNSELNNINIQNVQIEVSATGLTLSSSMYIASFAATATNSTFTNCVASLTTSVTANRISNATNANSYLAGLVASAEASTFTFAENSNKTALDVDFTLNVTLGNGKIGYVGGLVACLTNSSTITNAYVSLTASNNIPAKYLGGIVGYAENVEISSCKTSGTLTYAIPSGVKEYFYYGGIVGYGVELTLTNSTSNLVFTLSGNYNSYTLIGGIVGYVESGSLSECSYVSDNNYQNQTSLTSGTIILGAYGGAETGVTISNLNKI